jgi:hypothetical protein
LETPDLYTKLEKEVKQKLGMIKEEKTPAEEKLPTKEKKPAK